MTAKGSGSHMQYWGRDNGLERSRWLWVIKNRLL